MGQPGKPCFCSCSPGSLITLACWLGVRCGVVDCASASKQTSTCNMSCHVYFRILGQKTIVRNCLSRTAKVIARNHISQTQTAKPVSRRQHPTVMLLYDLQPPTHTRSYDSVPPTHFSHCIANTSLSWPAFALKPAVATWAKEIMVNRQLSTTASQSSTNSAAGKWNHFGNGSCHMPGRRLWAIYTSTSLP